MGGERKVRRVPLGSSLKVASFRHRAITCFARSIVSFILRLGPPYQRSRGPSRENESNQNLPAIIASIGGHGKVIADHDEHDWHGQERVVLGAQLGLRAQ